MILLPLVSAKSFVEYSLVIEPFGWIIVSPDRRVIETSQA